MSDDIQGIVETSLNLGVIRTRGKKIKCYGIDTQPA
jgi:hypothetical protein